MKNKTQTIEKKHIAAMAAYTIRHIPGVEERTLRKFLELVNITGSMGWISDEQLVETIRFMVKHVPGTCTRSLATLVELVAIYLPSAVVRVDIPFITLAEPYSLPDTTEVGGQVTIYRTEL